MAPTKVVGGPKISARRLMEDLHALRRFGAVDFDSSSRGGDGKAKGVCRPALTKADLEARGWFAERCREAGLATRIDKIGTTVAKGSSPPGGGKRLLCGSHSDSQATGGWLDGALGCAYALETARAFKDAGLPPAIDVVNFQDEEGRFGTLTGSGAFCSGGTLDWASPSLSPFEAAPKVTLREAVDLARPDLEAIGADMDLLLTVDDDDDDISGFFEAHVEQGRRLERGNRRCAAVSSIVGMRQLRLEAYGDTNHAGSTLMADRKDAFRALLGVVARVDEAFQELAEVAAPNLVWVFSVVDVAPGAPSIIPSKATCVLQFRDPDDRILDGARDAVDHLAQRSSSSVPVFVADDRPPLRPTRLDPAMVACVEDAVRSHLGPHDSLLAIHSGAVHDAASLANKAGVPSAMLFVPSINGISHDFTEDTHEDDIITGCQVFADAAANILRL
mmetsp:Transcript_10950/g.36251  ORF Transcript_10950/g.36251 Transcript_10950/m.36251 type:complete len:447 (+) Transcript_10950:1132-2472(+)